jgi:hypothetical protein
VDNFPKPNNPDALTNTHYHIFVDDPIEEMSIKSKFDLSKCTICQGISVGIDNHSEPRCRLCYNKDMPKVLCFDCGYFYEAPYGTKDITKQCPKCQGSKQP